MEKPYYIYSCEHEEIEDVLNYKLQPYDILVYMGADKKYYLYMYDGIHISYCKALSKYNRICSELSEHNYKVVRSEIMEAIQVRESSMPSRVDYPNILNVFATIVSVRCRDVKIIMIMRGLCKSMRKYVNKLYPALKYSCLVKPNCRILRPDFTGYELYAILNNNCYTQDDIHNIDGDNVKVYKKGDFVYLYRDKYIDVDMYNTTTDAAGEIFRLDYKSKESRVKFDCYNIYKYSCIEDLYFVLDIRRLNKISSMHPELGLSMVSTIYRGYILEMPLYRSLEILYKELHRFTSPMDELLLFESPHTLLDALYATKFKYLKCSLLVDPNARSIACKTNKSADDLRSLRDSITATYNKVMSDKSLRYEVATYADIMYAMPNMRSVNEMVEFDSEEWV